MLEQNVNQYKSIELTHGCKSNRALVVFMCVLVLTVVFALLLPWQQTVIAKGKVGILSPNERPQNLEAAIPGKIKQWFVKDGQFVKEGDPIVSFVDLDPKFLDPNQKQQLQSQKIALEARKIALEARIKAIQSQVSALGQSQRFAVPSASVKTQQTTDRLNASNQAVIVAEQNVKTASLNLNRLQQLYSAGLRSKRDLELAELENTRTQTELERAKASLNVSQKDFQIAGYDQSKVIADTTASLSTALASLADAKATLATLENDLNKLSLDQSILEQRESMRLISAPLSGQIVRLIDTGIGQAVDQGTIIGVIAPYSKDMMVELNVTENDAPLILPGRHVRLQFAGWPAIQFAGWPSIAVGTFAGKVIAIDAVDNGQNQFRVIVKPDDIAVSKHKDQPWPSPRYLRPGTQVTGWILLKRVPLWFELWRQFNAFPPSVDRPKDESKNDKPVKRKQK